MVGVRGRAGDAVNHGRLGPKGLYGSTPWASSPDRLTRPAGPRGRASWSRPTGTPRWAGSSSASQALLDGEGAAEPRLLHLRAAVPRGVLHPRGDREGRARHPAHGRQHPAVHRDQRGGVQGVASAPTGSPAPTPTSSTATRSSCTATTCAETQTVLWTRILDRTRGDDPPRIVCVDPRRTAVAARPSAPAVSTSRRASGTNLALMNGADPRAVRQRLGRRRTGSARTPSASTSCATTVEPYTPERVGRDLRRRRRRRPRGGADLRRERAACCPRCCRASTSPTRRRPPPCAVQQPAPAARA